MSPLAICLWITNLVLETAGHLSFKRAVSAADRWTLFLWIGIVCFALEFVVWFGLVSLIPLSQAILVNSASIVAVMFAGRIAFRERLTALRVAGASLIAAGVALAGTSA